MGFAPEISNGELRLLSEFRSCRPHLGVPILVAVCAWLRLITALILFLIRPYHVCVIGRNEHDLLATEQAQDCILALSTCPERRIPKLLCIRSSTSTSLLLSMQLLVWTSMTLVVYPPRVSDGRDCYRSCCIVIVIVLMTTTHHDSFPTRRRGAWKRSHGGALLVVGFVDGRKIERRNPDIGVRISASANPRTTTMMRTVASLATATFGTASVGIGTPGLGNVVIGNGGDGEPPSCCSLLFVTRTSPGPTGMTTL